MAGWPAIHLQGDLEAEEAGRTYSFLKSCVLILERQPRTAAGGGRRAVRVLGPEKPSLAGQQEGEKLTRRGRAWSHQKGPSSRDPQCTRENRSE